MAKIKEAFRKRGFEVTSKFKSEVDAGWYIIFSMANEEGVEFVYKPGTDNTQLITESGCSTDPAMDDYMK